MTENEKKLWAIGLGAVLVVALLPVRSGFAAGGHCDLSTLKGQYLIADSGWVFPPAFGLPAGSPPAIAAAAGYSVYNGDGTGEDHITFTLNGIVQPIPPVQPFVYALNRDCTGARTVNPSAPFPGPHFKMYVASDGSGLTEIATDPGFSVTSFNKRVGHSENSQ